MGNNEISVQQLLDRINILEEENKKLEITSRFYKMRFEEDLDKIKKDNDKMLEQILNAGRYNYHYEYPKVDLTADAVVFAFDKKDKKLKILLIKRGGSPYKGLWALPGGFIKKVDNKEETIEKCAQRELAEETKLEINKMYQMRVFSEPDRDPRGRVITVPFLALTEIKPVEGNDDAAYAEWVPIDDKIFDYKSDGVSPDPFLAFDHRQIIAEAREELKHRLYYEHVAFDLLGRSFTLTQVQELYEAILGLVDDSQKFDRSNFQKKLSKMSFLEKCTDDTVDPEKENVYRGTQRYRFLEKEYEEFKDKFKQEF